METNQTRSEAQQEASRINGAASRGPITEEGKQRSSQNARKHDFFTDPALLKGEDREEFQQVLSLFTEEHQPSTPTERAYVYEMADGWFRLHRVRRHAADIQSRAAEDMSEAFEKLAEEGKSLQLCLRYEKHFKHQFDSALKMLIALRRNRPPQPEPELPEEEDLARNIDSRVKVIERLMFGFDSSPFTPHEPDEEDDEQNEPEEEE